MAEEQVPVTYFLAVIFLMFLILRYVVLSAPAQPQDRPQRNATARQQGTYSRSREAAAEQVHQMFPQADVRTILWNLQRHGGDVQRIIDLVLAGRLETPPITFQPILASAQQRPATGATTRPMDKATQPDLITRYNLKDKLTSTKEEPTEKSKGWSSSRDERQASLQRRREEMILAARKKLEAKLAAQAK